MDVNRRHATHRRRYTALRSTKEDHPMFARYQSIPLDVLTMNARDCRDRTMLDEPCTRVARPAPPRPATR